MKALYRRYRPMELGDVIGQPQVTEPLESALAAGKINHAYLFIGPRGCGKTTVARILAHKVNNFKYQLEDDYVDIVEIDGASNRGIDDIRELREKAAIAPTAGKYKVYIIDEVHMLTTPAFNALLKTLEEPPAHVIFIMATTDAHKVPVTITSRSQTYTFKLADEATMLRHLKQIATKEHIDIDTDALKVIAKRGGGSYRDSMSLLDQISTLSTSKITKDMVISAMGLPADESITALLQAYASADVVKITTLYKDLLMSGIKPDVLAGEIISQIIDNPKPQYLPLLSQLPDVKDPYAEARLLVALTSTVKITPEATPATNSPQSPSKGNPPQPTSATKPHINITDTPPAATQPEPPTAFNWQSLLDHIQQTSEVIYKQLTKCQHDFSHNNLHLYPKTKIIKNIIAKPNNKKIITSQLGTINLIIHEAGEHPDSFKKDETLSKISDIMGGEVINDGGINPF